jgi:hypothetical protein
MSPCRLVGGFQCLWGVFCLHLHRKYSSDALLPTYLIVCCHNIEICNLKEILLFEIRVEIFMLVVWLLSNEVGWWMFLSSDTGYIPFPYWKWVLLLDCIVSYQRRIFLFLHVSWTEVNWQYWSECFVKLTAGRLISNCSFTFVRVNLLCDMLRLVFGKRRSWKPDGRRQADTFWGERSIDMFITFCYAICYK